MDFDQQIVINVINAETGGTWDCTLKGRDGELGCLQIIPKYHPNVDPMDFEASVRYFITAYKAGNGYWWTSCSCSKSASLTAKVPILNAEDYPINSTLQEGKLAVLRYGSQYHVVSYKITPTGLLARLEGNWKPCLLKDRLITWEELDRNLIGFYSPTQ